MGDGDTVIVIERKSKTSCISHRTSRVFAHRLLKPPAKPLCTSSMKITYFLKMRTAEKTDSIKTRWMTAINIKAVSYYNSILNGCEPAATFLQVIHFSLFKMFFCK